LIYYSNGGKLGQVEPPGSAPRIDAIRGAPEARVIGDERVLVEIKCPLTLGHYRGSLVDYYDGDALRLIHRGALNAVSNSQARLYCRDLHRSDIGS
jgi:hypothetical protein